MLLIFDLDGTLLNTIADLGAACNHALQACGYATHPLEEYPQLVGNGVNKLIERALPDGHKDEATILRAKEYFVAYYNEHNCDMTRPYDGIPELLTELKKEGHKLAVASNKYQEATEKLVRHFFGNTFDVVLGERSGIPRKPDPRIVQDILEKESESAEVGKVLYIGDSDVDMQTAKNAGLPSVACTWGFCKREKLEACKPTFIIQEPKEILSCKG